MLTYLGLFIIIYGSVWVARRSVNKRIWSDVFSKLSSGKPENLLVFNSSISDLETIHNKLTASILNSDYKLVNAAGNQIVLEDKKPSSNLLNTMYFYPVYISGTENGQTRIEIGIVDKSSFLSNKQDSMQKLQKLFNFISKVI